MWPSHSDVESRMYTNPRARLLEDRQIVEREKTGGMAAPFGSAGKEGSFGLHGSSMARHGNFSDPSEDQIADAVQQKKPLGADCTG